MPECPCSHDVSSTVTFSRSLERHIWYSPLYVSGNYTKVYPDVQVHIIDYVNKSLEFAKGVQVTWA